VASGLDRRMFSAALLLCVRRRSGRTSGTQTYSGGCDRIGASGTSARNMPPLYVRSGRTQEDVLAARGHSRVLPAQPSDKRHYRGPAAAQTLAFPQSARLPTRSSCISWHAMLARDATFQNSITHLKRSDYLSSHGDFLASVRVDGDLR